ncbi:MAG: hypothetical protein ACX933_18145, partial [Marinobacter adhaerens]
MVKIYGPHQNHSNGFLAVYNKGFGGTFRHFKAKEINELISKEAQRKSSEPVGGTTRQDAADYVDTFYTSSVAHCRNPSTGEQEPCLRHNSEEVAFVEAATALSEFLEGISLEWTDDPTGRQSAPERKFFQDRIGTKQDFEGARFHR